LLAMMLPLSSVSLLRARFDRLRELREVVLFCVRQVRFFVLREDGED